MDRDAMTQYHRVTIEVDVDDPGTEDEYRTLSAVRFECTAPPDADCRTYPDNCGCELFTEDRGNPGRDEQGHRYEPGQSCWVQDWFDAEAAADSTYYDGPDREYNGDAGIPPIARSGHVQLVGFWVDEGPHWVLVPDPSPLQLVATAHGATP